jgi:3-hydroxyisobutyrate dehydrogenase-like beta-hydroxyacid dehydrogenase
MRIGIIGSGNMARGIAHRLLGAGHEVMVSSRDRPVRRS